MSDEQSPPPLISRAQPADAQSIISLSAHVQSALTSSGSLQEIGPLPLPIVSTSIQGGHLFTLHINGKLTGSVMVDPLDGVFPNTSDIDLTTWDKARNIPAPRWYLHALMIEPMEQGRGLGGVFVEGVLRLMGEEKKAGGTVVLDCWAGNVKLREFYEKLGFVHHGDFPERDYQISVYTYFIPVTS